MAYYLGAKQVDITMPLDHVTKVGGRAKPYFDVPLMKDGDNLRILLAGPAVSLIDQDPYAMQGARYDFHKCLKIMNGYGYSEPPIKSLLRLLSELVDAIRQDPIFMKEVSRMGADIMEHYGF